MNTHPVLGADCESFTMMSNCATYPGHTRGGTGGVAGTGAGTLRYRPQTCAPFIASHQLDGCLGSFEANTAALTTIDPSSNWASPVVIFGVIAEAPHSFCSE